jgi:hypothetical protein
MFIKELMDIGSEVLLFPRPRRFGKTLNMSMVQFYFEQSPTVRAALFSSHAIWQQGEAYTREQGKYPVISISFKDVKYSKWQEGLAQLQRLLADECERHRPILEKAHLSVYERQCYVRMCHRQADMVDYVNCLKDLTQWLHRATGTRVIVLIDEYDVPLQEGYLHGYYDDIVEFFRNLFSAVFKDNPSLQRGMLTGILRVSKESIFSGLNNLDIYSLLHPEFDASFGFTQEEVAHMHKVYGVGEPMEHVQAWYNGYVFGQTNVYNPWSIINFMQKWRRSYENYWGNTGDPALIIGMLQRVSPKTYDQLWDLLEGKSVVVNIHDRLTYRDLDAAETNVWTFLLYSGYLTPAHTERPSGTKVALCIPNREVKESYYELIETWFAMPLGDRRHQQMIEAFVRGDAVEFGEKLQQFVLDVWSHHDIRADEAERVYHMFMLGLLVQLHDRYEIISNREAGKGRYDVCMIPRSMGMRQDKGEREAIVLEFKKGKTVGQLHETAAQAIAQIEEKQYTREVKNRGVKRCMLLGMAFCGKDVVVQGKRETF